MDKRRLFLMVVFLFVLTGNVAGLTLAEAFAGYVWLTVKPVICGLYISFVYIAAAAAALMIVYGGIKWIGSSDDPGARKTAKDTIIHAIVALIIVVGSAAIVDMIISTGEKCW